MRIPAATALFLLAALHSRILAGNEDSLLDQARALAKKGDVLAAAKAFGQAAEAVQERGDLMAEQRVAEALFRFLDGLPLTPTATQKTSVVMAVAEILPEMNWDRTGVFISYPALGTDALYIVTQTGVFDGAWGCSRRLEGWALAKKKGRPIAGKILKLYASAIDRIIPSSGGNRITREIDAMDFAIALEELEEAQAAAIKHGFTELMVHITAELVARLHGRKESAKAMAAHQRAVKSLGPGSDLEILIAWSSMLRTRLKGQAAPYDNLVAGLIQTGKRPDAGAGQPGGQGPHSRLGEKWKHFKRGRRLLQVTRTKKGMKVAPAYARDLALELTAEPGERYRDVGGIHLIFHGHAVAIRGIDLTGRVGLPGGGPHRTRWRPFYLLAEGEKLDLDSRKGLIFRR